MNINIENVTQAQAMDLIRTFFNEFGFVGTYFTREDAESRIERQMTDAEWERLRSTRAWRRDIEEAMVECSWDYIEFALEDAELSA